MAVVDRAKNSLKTARVVRNLGSQIFQDRVGKADKDDLYRVQLNSSSFNFSATGSSRAALQLFSLKQPAKALRTIGKIAFSDLSRSQLRKYVVPLGTSRVNAQPLSLTLAAGTYYLRVAQAQGNSRYRLSLAASALSPVPGSAPTPAPGSAPTPVPGSTPVPSPTPVFSLAAFRSQTWVRQFGTAQNDYAFGTALSSSSGSNSVYVAGVTSPGNAFSGQGFVTQYSRDGVLGEQRNLATSGSTAVADVAVDDSGNYYVVGATVEGTNSDAFIAKYSAVGQQQWRRTIQSSILGFSAADAAASVVIDDNNSIYVTGIRRGAPTPFSQGKAFVAKYASNGSLEAAFGDSGIVEFGDAKTTAASGITVANGRVYLTGITDATLNLSDGGVSLTGGDAFVASFDRLTGALAWNQTLSSGGSTDYGRGIAVSGSDLYIVGQTSGVLPSGSLAANSYGGGDSDAFLAKYAASSGSLQWSKQIGSTGLDAAQAIAIDPAGRIYLTGETNTSLFGSALGGSDAWIAQADASGNLLSASQFGTARNDEAYSLTTDSTGAIYLAGQTQGSFPAAMNQGNYDAWLAKYDA